LPNPTFGDIRRFCEIDGWEDVTERRKVKRRDHFRYEKVLEDGRVLRTRASHGNDQIGDRGLWQRILKDQLELDNEEQFWDALRTREPVDRGSDDPQPPSGPTKPAWLVRNLIVVVGVPEPDVQAMDEQEAIERWETFRITHE
jgi:hypothetical protein